MLFNRTVGTLMCVALIAAIHVAAARAQKDDGFRKFYADFQNAVKTGDKESVAGLTNFDHFTWEASDTLRQVKTKADFLKNYDKMFTAVVKNKIASAKPVKADEGYFILWHTRDLEYSLYFAHEKDGGYSFLGLTVGPR